MDFAEDGIAFIKTLLQTHGYWTGPIVDVSAAPPIAPPSQRNQNNFVLAQAR